MREQPRHPLGRARLKCGHDRLVARGFARSVRKSIADGEQRADGEQYRGEKYKQNTPYYASDRSCGALRRGSICFVCRRCIRRMSARPRCAHCRSRGGGRRGYGPSVCRSPACDPDDGVRGADERTFPFRRLDSAAREDGRPALPDTEELPAARPAPPEPESPAESTSDTLRRRAAF